MKINRSWKITIGIATFLFAILPFVMVALTFSSFFTMGLGMVAMPEDQLEIDPGFFTPMLLLFILSLCIFPLQIGLYVFYAIHLIKNTIGSDVLRILFLLGMFFLPYLALPAYFLIFIAPNQTPQWALEANK